MKTTTIRGNPVELEPTAWGDVLVTIRHPTHGEIRYTAEGWGPAKDGTEGVKGYAAHKGKTLAMVVSIPRGDYEAVLTEAAALKAKGEADRLAKLGQDRDEARAKCPEGHEIARRLPCGIDSCLCNYEAEDGTTVLASDQLPLVNGWAYIARSDLDAERVKIATKKSIAARLEAERVEKRAKAFEMAKSSSKPAILRQWTTDCNDPNEECSCDTCTEWARPDGTTETTRAHSW